MSEQNIYLGATTTTGSWLDLRGRLPRRALSQHVQVRFSPEQAEQIQRRAERAGMTLSSWVRRAVDAALTQEDSDDD